MIVLAPVQRLLRFSGLWFEPNQSALYSVWRLFCFAVLTMLLQPQFAFLCANLDDIIVATDVSIQLVSEVMASAKVVSYLCHRGALMDLLAQFQRDFD